MIQAARAVLVSVTTLFTFVALKIALLAGLVYAVLAIAGQSKCYVRT
jgi:hypothetical protein